MFGWLVAFLKIFINEVLLWVRQKEKVLFKNFLFWKILPLISTQNTHIDQKISKNVVFLIHFCRHSVSDSLIRIGIYSDFINLAFVHMTGVIRLESFAVT